MKRIILILFFLPMYLFAQHPYLGITIRDSSSFSFYIDIAETDANTQYKFVVVDSFSYAINDTVPDNVLLTFNRNGCLAGDSTTTLYVNGTFDADLVKVIDGSITIRFDISSVKVAYPEWWGLSTDSTDQNAFNAMWKAFPAGRKPEMKLTGSYYTNDTWTIRESFRDSSGYSADAKGIARDHPHIIGYGSAIYSEADTILKVQLGWLAQSEHNQIIEGLRIFGNGYEKASEPDDRDTGTNIGIYVEDTGKLTIFNCTIRNCGDAIVFAHKENGAVFVPYCDSPKVLYNHLIVNDRCIVFVDIDSGAGGVDADFDRGLVIGNQLGIGNGDNDTLDACITISKGTRVSRSTFRDNDFLTTDSTNFYYINGGFGGSILEANGEATNGNVGQKATVFRIGNDYEDVGSVGTAWGLYSSYAYVKQTSGSPDIVKNYTGKRFTYTEWLLRNGFQGHAFVDWTGNVPNTQLQSITVTGGYTQGSNLMYLFNGDSGDTTITDISGNILDMNINVGTTQEIIDSTKWKVRSMDGVDDCMSSGLHNLQGNQMIICAIKPGAAYNVGATKRLWKWYTNDSNLVYINWANGSGSTVLGIYADNGVSTDSASITTSIVFSANDPLIYGCVIDTVNDLLELWINGNKRGVTAYTGNLVSTSSNFAIGAEWGCASLYTAMDVGFFAVYPYINRKALQEISNHVLSVMGKNDNDLIDTKFIQSVGGDSLGVIYYNTTAARLDTVWQGQTVGGGTGDFLAVNYGDSLLNYDGYGVIITDNDAIDVDSSEIATQHDISALKYQNIYFSLDYPMGTEADTSWIWQNSKGSTVTLDSIYAISDLDTFRIILCEMNETGGGSVRIDSVAITADGTNLYYKKETTLTHSTIENGHWIGMERAKDEADYISINIYYHY